MTTPLLDFTTLEPERPKIRIDGKLYELAILSDFGLTAQSRLARLMKEASEIEASLAARPALEPTGNPTADAALAALDAVSEPEAERVIALLNEIVELILRAPADIRAKLSEIQKRQLIEAFTPTVTAATPTKTKSRPSPSTSGPSARSSRRPTATVPG